MSRIVIHQKKVIYSLVGKSESDISPVWQILQVFFYASCTGAGFALCWLYTHLIKLVQSHCVLYAGLLLTGKRFGEVRGVNVSCTVDLLQPLVLRRWTHCDVILMIVVLTTTVAIFFLVMFIYWGRGGAGKPTMPDAWRIVWPAIIINTIASCFAVFSAFDFTNGLFSFQDNIQKQWRLNVSNFDLDDISCLQLGNDVIGERLSTGLFVLKEVTILWVSFWILNLFWIVMRCLFNVDFQLVCTTIYEYSRKPALVRRPIISYPNEDNLGSMQKRKSVKFVLPESDDNKEPTRGKKTRRTDDNLSKSPTGK